MGWPRRTPGRRSVTASQQMDANRAAGRDQWHGIANHTRHTPRERLPQVGPYPAAPPPVLAEIIPATPARLPVPAWVRDAEDQMRGAA